MNYNRPNVLSIAGFDPSAGAGVLADVKTFEQCGVYGMGVISALTYQNDITFDRVEWLSLQQIISQIDVLQQRFQFDYIKIGLIENLNVLNKLVDYLTQHPTSNIYCQPEPVEGQHPKIIFDPILKASTGFEFHNSINKNLLEKICSQLYLITPNIPEALQLGDTTSAIESCNYLSSFCNVYLKGGHSEESKGKDIFLKKETKQQIVFDTYSSEAHPKHGSGCVLSSAITAFLAKGLSLEEACSEAKKYITSFLSSTETLLGYHSGITLIEHE